MSNLLERLEKEKREMIDRHRRERKDIDDKIAKEKERIKREKEAEKKKKELQPQQYNDPAYQSFVRDSMSIAEINKIVEEFLMNE